MPENQRRKFKLLLTKGNPLDLESEDHECSICLDGLIPWNTDVSHFYSKKMSKATLSKTLGEIR
jgi:hypothetical protein